MQKGVGTTDEETIFPLLYTDACPSQNSDKTPHLHFMYCIVYRIFLPPPLCNLIQDIPAAANLQIVYRIEIVYSTYAKLTNTPMQVGPAATYACRVMLPKSYQLVELTRKQKIGANIRCLCLLHLDRKRHVNLAQRTPERIIRQDICLDYNYKHAAAY